MKKGQKLSYVGEYSVNGDEKRKQDIVSNKSNKGEEEPLCPCIKGVELPTFEGGDPVG